MLENYWLSNEYEIKNVNEVKNDLAPAELDFYFINKNSYNQYKIFIIEVKDLSLKSLKICDYYQFVSEKITILKKDVKLSETIFPMFYSNCSFFRINIIKDHQGNIEYAGYEYKPKKINGKVRELISYRDWKVFSIRQFKYILQNTSNENLNQVNLDLLKRKSYGNDLLASLLNHSDNNLIKNVAFSIGNISKFAKADFIGSNRLITKINGLPGSGKTIFAFLLFVTERNLLLIVSNIAFYNKFIESTAKIERKNNNKFALIWNLTYRNEIIESELMNFKIIVIDESQNIDNHILTLIATFCCKHKIRLFLLSDYKQNVYSSYNLTGIEGTNKLEEKQKLLENSLETIYGIKKLPICEWKASNRINSRDLEKIGYIVFGDKGKLHNYLNQTKEKSILQIYPCVEMNLSDLSRKYNKEQIFIVSHFNWMDDFNNLENQEYDYYNQYQQIGCEYDNLTIYLPTNFEYDEIQKKLIYRFIDRSDNIEKILPDEVLESWLYVAFTRATKSISIFVAPKNKYKLEICKYFNGRLEDLEHSLKNPNNFVSKINQIINVDDKQLV